jgi:hypothetical protein
MRAAGIFSATTSFWARFRLFRLWALTGIATFLCFGGTTSTGEAILVSSVLSQEPAGVKNSSMKVALNVYLKFSSTWKKLDDTEIPAFTCIKKCNGKKHKKHSECDDSCDEPETAKQHSANLEGKYTELAAEGDQAPKQSHGKTLDEAFTKFGLPGTVSGQSILGKPDAIRVFTNEGSGKKAIITVPEFNVQVNSNHWAKPCSSSQRFVKAKQYEVDVKFELIDQEPNAAPVAGPSGNLRYKVIIPTTEFSRTTDPYVVCNCEVTQSEPPKDQGMIPGWTPNPGGSNGEYAWVEENGMKRPIVGSDLAQLISNISVPSMNEAFITQSAMPKGNALIPAGWELECINDEGQDVQLQDDYPIYLAEPGLLWAQEGFSLSEEQQKKLRVLCLEIHKPQPTTAMKFRLKPPRDIALMALAQMFKNSRIRGPWDQVRLWIATDKASFDEMAKVLMPMPGPATYVRGLWQCALAGAISTLDPKIRTLMENRFLLAENSTPEADRWMLSEKLKLDPKGIAKWFLGQKSAVASLFTQGDPKEDIDLINVLASELANNGGAEGLAAALFLLKEATPEAHRAALVNMEGAEDIALALMAVSDEKTANAILDWLEIVKPKTTTLGCLNVNPALSDAIKERALKLIPK